MIPPSTLLSAAQALFSPPRLLAAFLSAGLLGSGQAEENAQPIPSFIFEDAAERKAALEALKAEQIEELLNNYLWDEVHMSGSKLIRTNSNVSYKEIDIYSSFFGTQGIQSWELVEDEDAGIVYELKTRKQGFDELLRYRLIEYLPNRLVFELINGEEIGILRINHELDGYYDRAGVVDPDFPSYYTRELKKLVGFRVILNRPRTEQEEAQYYAEKSQREIIENFTTREWKTNLCLLGSRAKSTFELDALTFPKPYQEAEFALGPHAISSWNIKQDGMIRDDTPSFILTLNRQADDEEQKLLPLKFKLVQQWGDYYEFSLFNEGPLVKQELLNASKNGTITLSKKQQASIRERFSELRLTLQNPFFFGQKRWQPLGQKRTDASEELRDFLIAHKWDAWIIEPSKGFSYENRPAFGGMFSLGAPAVQFRGNGSGIDDWGINQHAGSRWNLREGAEGDLLLCLLYYTSNMENPFVTEFSLSSRTETELVFTLHNELEAAKNLVIGRDMQDEDNQEFLQKRLKQVQGKQLILEISQ